MTEKKQQFNQWFDQYANGVKVFEEADMKQAYLQGRAELEKENAELKETVTKMNNVITETFRNLSKAKEIIKIFLKYEICTLNIKDELADNITKAKAFLKSEVEK